MRRGFLLTLLIAALALPTGRVGAHAALSDSTPADGAVVTEPLSEVTLTFSEGVEPTADGFAVTVDGSAVEAAVTSTDGALWVLGFGPVRSGTVAVSYNVVSVDGHPIAGALTFTVDAPAVATTLGSPPPSAPPTSATPTAAAPTTTAATTDAPSATTSVVGPPATTAAAGTPATAATETDEAGSDTVLWVLVIGGGVALLGVLGWVVARRARP